MGIAGDGDVLNIPNDVGIRIDNQMDENRMEEDNNNNRGINQVAISDRAIVRAEDGYEVNIVDFNNSPFVYYNQNQLPYATSIHLKFPGNAEITPIDIDGMKATKETTSIVDGQPVKNYDTVKIKFKDFIDNVTPDLELNPGDAVSVLVPDKITDPETGLEKNTNKIATFYNNHKNTIKFLIDFGAIAYKMYKWYNGSSATPLDDITTSVVRYGTNISVNDIPNYEILEDRYGLNQPDKKGEVKAQKTFQYNYNNGKLELIGEVNQKMNIDDEELRDDPIPEITDNVENVFSGFPEDFYNFVIE